MNEYRLEKVIETNREELVSFLHRYANFSLFLLQNLHKYGYQLTDHDHSGNYKLIRREKNIVCVFSLTKRGNLLVTAESKDPSLFSLIVKACEEESIRLQGLLGDWEICHPFWEFLKENKIITRESLVSKEVLYSTALTEKKTSGQREVKVLSLSDFDEWLNLDREYRKELHFPSNQSRDELYREFSDRVEKKIVWGLVEENQIVSMAALNAQVGDIAQVGGVYTRPLHRKRGYSRRVMLHLLHETKTLHQIRKLIIFTGEGNISARKLYESLGVEQVGNYALLFGCR